MRLCDFGHVYFAIFLKFVLQKNYVYHLCSLRNLSFSEDNAEKKIDCLTLVTPPVAPYALNFCRKIYFTKKDLRYQKINKIGSLTPCS